MFINEDFFDDINTEQISTDDIEDISSSSIDLSLYKTVLTVTIIKPNNIKPNLEDLKTCIKRLSYILSASSMIREISEPCIKGMKTFSKNSSLSYEEAYNRASEVLDNNKAYEMFKTWISNQGGDLSKLKISDKVILIKSNQDGIISHINALKVGELSVKLGAGRITKDSKIDYSVGIKLLKQSGDLVKKGDILAKLYVNDLNIKLTKDDINFYSVK